jgi:hypothetical protein
MKRRTGINKVFSELVTSFCKKELPWGKMVGFITDGVSAVISKKRTVLQQH